MIGEWSKKPTNSWETFVEVFQRFEAMTDVHLQQRRKHMEASHQRLKKHLNALDLIKDWWTEAATIKTKEAAAVWARRTDKIPQTLAGPRSKKLMQKVAPHILLGFGTEFTCTHHFGFFLIAISNKFVFVCFLS